MSFVETLKKRAAADIKTITLPEGSDVRTIEAAVKIKKEGFANVILLGKKEEIVSKAGAFDLSGIEIIEPEKHEKYEEFCEKFYEMRKAKGMTPEKAHQIMKDEIYYAVMMVGEGLADGMVSGACHTTADTLRPALQILKTAPGYKVASAFFVMCVPNCEYGENGVFIFADSGLVENPDADTVSEIAIASAGSFKTLVDAEPKVAMLSYSTYGSAKSELVDKMQLATKLAKEKAPDMLIDGELQLDAAIVPAVNRSKAPGSPLEGKANVLVFPDLNCGNIAYKLVQRLAKAEAYGPVMQGLKKPVNDLSRGCSADDIVGVVAITCVQAIAQGK